MNPHAILLAVYVTAVYYAPHKNAIHWHEFQLDQRFFVRGLCESYRPKLVHEWLNKPGWPNRTEDVMSTRCGPWEVDPDVGDAM